MKLHLRILVFSLLPFFCFLEPPTSWLLSMVRSDGQSSVSRVGFCVFGSFIMIKRNLFGANFAESELFAKINAILCVRIIDKQERE